jgi:hypothetical protein
LESWINEGKVAAGVGVTIRAPSAGTFGSYGVTPGYFRERPGARIATRFQIGPKVPQRLTPTLILRAYGTTKVMPSRGLASNRVTVQASLRDARRSADITRG